MSSAACGEPLSLMHLPSREVARLAGAQLAVILDPPTTGSPTTPNGFAVIERLLLGKRNDEGIHP